MALKTVTSLAGTFTDEDTVSLTAGVPYILYVAGTFDEVALQGIINSGEDTFSIPVLSEPFTGAGGKIFYAPCSNFEITASGTSNEVFYCFRMVVQPTLHVGATSYV
jgi:hypothetical protein